MKYKVTTKQGNNYIVSDDSAWLWITLERELGYTIQQAAAKMAEGSLDVITWIIHKAALDSKQTELKTQKTWVEHEFETFELVEEEDPKATPAEA
jgi:ppGpp synthetase/RelA/SpoT-type nucleotidyltranferase